ncbi:MAG: dihydrofolate reductase [Oscillibacter sp.]|jgi:dihydrofolate reductase|nr:dihydrofolate reductase [Oscillibacter sp.]
MDAIVAVDRNWAIGKDGKLLFSLPTDIRRFRSLTLGGTVLMGRKTLDSFPGGRPLPGRRNVVLSTNMEPMEGLEIVRTPAALLGAVSGMPTDHVFVIGGGSVYTALLRYCKRVFLTRVDAAADTPDTFFPNLDKLPGWEVEKTGEPVSENGLTYRFVDYVNTRL